MSESEGGRVRVLIVDDHAVVRAGLRALVEMEGRFQVVGEAGTAQEAVERALADPPDVVLMDVRLPGESGIEACREIRARLPGTRVVMLTSYPDEQAVVASVLAGASGYLLKDIDPRGLRDALEIVARGGSLLSPDLVTRVLAGVRRQAESGPGPDAIERLTAQERQILTLIAEGKTNREIGEVLYLSEHTVKNYISRLFEKLGLSRRSEAAAYLARYERRVGLGPAAGGSTAGDGNGVGVR
ncbi:response regulator [Caldinitratiruptor microaerophilus]|uniref:Stage 0 sporulation protein A homolog n=1 Tax=Caldinitratiruptor microaerophilus TaxID=671077 RepID=A0AA35CN55_9FIRM|nr:response regulator transcription factor [Caldinitratiruptor microaerophilus]BDG62197.1 DNA-binding response regulator [Caldinitratiruptor microaerophilus]